MATQQITGVYGGAFNPVHEGHLQVMRMAVRQLGLRTLVLVPSAAAPHKTTVLPFAQRVEMLRIATQGLPVVIDEIEQTWSGPTYSSQVLPALQAKYGPIVHIIGGDSIVAMPTWHCPQQVMAFAHAVVARGSVDGALLEAIDYATATYGAHIRLLQGAPADYSSSAIRLAYRIGAIDYQPTALSQSALYGVPQSVHNYIVSHGLYHEYAAIVAGVSASISPARWLHSQGVARMAMQLNAQLRLDETQVLTAALLHDCAKSQIVVDPSVPAEICRYPSVVHAFNGAALAATRYGVTDTAVLDAIRYHTTGRPAMSRLEQLIYLADMCEEGRTYPQAQAIRRLALDNFDQGFLAAVRRTHDYLQMQNIAVCPLGEDCYQYYTRSSV